MKGSVTDVIRRGFENAVANWPLMLIRIAEGIVFVVVAIVAVVAAVVPIAVSIGVKGVQAPTSADDVAQIAAGIVLNHWMAIVFVLIVVSVLLILFIAVHSFVEAGSARVYVEAERSTAAIATPTRAQFRAFTADRWLEGGRRGWWPVFWIYNLAWSVACLILIAPLIVIGVLMIVVHQSPPALAVTGCLGLALFVLFLIPVAIVTNIWCQKAIVVWAARGAAARESLRLAWREFRADFARHLGVAVILLVLMFVGSLMLSTMTSFRLRHVPGFDLATLPLQFVGTFANTIFSAAMSSWFLACFAALTAEPRR